MLLKRLAAVFCAASLLTMPFAQPELCAAVRAAAATIPETAVSAATVVDSGYCGNQLKWWLESDGTLTISGNDDMTRNVIPPWSDYRGFLTEEDIRNGKSVPETVIRKLVIDKDVKSLAPAAFAQCKYLTEVSNLSTVMTGLPDYCFNGCDVLTSVTIPAQIESIGAYAFALCTSLKTVKLPAGLVFLETGVFGKCRALTSLTLPDRLLGIYTDAFTECTSLTSLVIPDSVNMVQHGAFEGAKCVEYTGNIGYVGTWAVSVKGEAEGETAAVTSHSFRAGTRGICNSLLQSHKELTAVTFPDSLMWIGDSAFNSTGITDLTLPSGVAAVGTRAFYFCISLRQLTIREGLRLIGQEAFSNCNRLTSVTLPASLQYIDPQAFYDCTELASIRANCLTCTVGSHADVFGFSTENDLQRTVTAYETFTWLADYARNDPNCKFIPLTPAGSGWSFSDGSLTITSSDVDRAEWKELNDRIQSITVSGSVSALPEDVFRNCDQLTSVTLEDGVTEIGSGAFSGCTGLTEIVFPESVLRIGADALSGCTGLKQVTVKHPGCDIADSAKTIPQGTVICWSGSTAEHYAKTYSLTSAPDLGTCFAAGTNIWISGTDHTAERLWVTGTVTEVTIPDWFTSLGKLEFAELNSMETLSLPDTLSSIGEGAFCRCTGLKSVVIPGSLRSIPRYAFADCVSLRTVTLQSGVTEIRAYAFDNCSELTSVSMPGTLITIGEGAFQNCSGLKTVTVPEGVSTIQQYAFKACSGLKEITLPSTLTQIGGSALAACSRLETVTFYCLSFSGNPLIPEAVTIRGYANSAIQEYAEKNNYPFAPLDENTVLSSGALGRTCTYKLFGNGLLQILGEGDMPDYGAADQAPAPWDYARDFISEVVIGEGITAIGDAAFCSMSKLRTVTLPDTVTRIGSNAFADCSLLPEITLPAALRTVGSCAFSDCAALSELLLPKELETIGSRAFSGCTSLTEIVIPDSVTMLGTYAFSGCTKLTSVTLPTGIHELDTGTFSSCTSLAPITIPENVTKITDAFGSQTPVKEITVLGLRVSMSGSLSPETVVACYTDSSLWNYLVSSEIPHRALNESELVASGELGEGITWELNVEKELTIKGKGNTEDFYLFAAKPWDTLVFYTVIISEGIESIGKYTFESNKNIRHVKLPRTLKTIGEGAFYGCENLVLDSLPDSITEIGFSAFHNTHAIETITLPNTSCKIGKKAFGLSSVQQVVIPARITVLNTSAFDPVRESKTLVFLNPDCTINADTSEVSDLFRIVGFAGSTAEAFAEKYHLEFELIDETQFTTEPLGTETTTTATTTTTTVETTVTSTETTERATETTFDDPTPRMRFDPVTATLTCSGNGPITNYDLYGGFTKDTVRRIVIGDGITEIGGGTFTGCTNLESIQFGRNVEYIGESAFQNCNSLREIILPNSLIYIDDQAFYSCQNLERVTFGDNLRHIGRQAFYGCGLYTLSLPDSLTELQEEAFGYCKALQTATIGSGVTEISNRLFFSCQSLQTVSFSGKIVQIGDTPFFGCDLRRICGQSDSILSSYAEENGISFEPPKDHVFTCFEIPDFNGDGTVSIADAVALVKCITESAEIEFLNYPVIELTMLDLKYLLKYLNEMSQNPAFF